MKEREFTKFMQDRFLPGDKRTEVRARPIAEAMQTAVKSGSGEFTLDGETYRITQNWVDHCIGGNCCPATCYSDWKLTGSQPTA